MSRARTLFFPLRRDFRTLPYVNLRRVHRASCGAIFLGAMLLGAGLTMAPSARAEAPSAEVRARAKASADKAIAAMEAGRWQEAIDLLKNAERMIHAPTHQLYIARAEAKLGRLVKAHEVYQEVIKEKLSPKSPRVFVEAQLSAMKEDKILVDQIPHVRITVDGPDAASADVLMDGRRLDPALLANPVAVDPGEHVFVAKVTDNESPPVTVTIPEGSERPVRLSLRAKVAAVVAEDEDVVKPRRERPTSGTGLRTGGFVALGVGVVGAAIGTYFLVTQRSEQSNANELMAACLARYGGTGCPTNESIPISAADASAKGAAAGAIVGYVVGGVGIAAGVTLLVVSAVDSGPSKPSKAGFLGVRELLPVVGPTSVGLRGSF